MLDSTHPNANLLLSFILLLVIAGLTAYYADRKGRNASAWFVISLLIGLIAPIILFFLPTLKKEEEIKNSKGVDHPSTSTQPSPSFVPPKQLGVMEDKLWYYLDKDHQQYGPVSIIALKDLFDRGQLDLNSYVWSEGMEKWENIDDLPALKEAFKHYQG